jgi:lipopolysaccharide/colanic/teichoic acid biosynthesis glycosyltransferase
MHLLADKFMVRHFIKPGITGLAQTKGFRVETNQGHYQQSKIYFLHGKSGLFVDIKIIFFDNIQYYSG